MYIAPNSTIVLLSGVPLDNTYTDTLIFENAQTQATHFLSNYTKKTYDYNTYQRVERKYIRLSESADNIYNYNYLMFRNTNYGSRWFYAFIKSIEYINNAVCQIEFEIDVMQTWHFDYELEQCLVERETSASDELFEHVYPEQVDYGDIVCHEQFIPQSLQVLVSDSGDAETALSIGVAYGDRGTS